MNKLKAFIEKAYYRFYKYFIIGKNRQCFFKGQNKYHPRACSRDSSLKQVIFYLADSKIVHLGDSLWFEPIARLLSQYFDVAICPNQAMEFYFSSLGFKIVTADEISPQLAIIVAPIELMFKLKHLKNVLFLSFDYRNVPPGGKLINSMLNSVAQEFGLNPTGVDGRYRALSFTAEQIAQNVKKFNLEHDKKYVIFNNYIDSWGKHTTQELVDKYANRLINYAKEYKNQNPDVTFIYTGSPKDKVNNLLLSDDLIDIDLRGKTSIEDLFMLVNTSAITLYIGFDAFLLHLFNMYDKPAYILLKPGNPDEVNNLIIQHVLIPYVAHNNVLPKLIDYA